MKNTCAFFLLFLSLHSSAEVVLTPFLNPSSGLIDEVKIRTEAITWARENVQGLDHLTEEKKTGLYYIFSSFYSRIQNLDALRPVYDEIFAQLKPGDVSYSPYFVKEGIKIAILTPGEHVTDFPEYAHWRGKTVEEVFGYPGDHRLMDDIDGEATRNTCLLRETRVGSSPRGSANTFYHEFGHFIHMTLLQKEEFFKVEKMYLAAKEKNAFLDNYAAQSVHEYFAQGLEAYLAETKTDRDRKGAYTKSDRHDLLKLDPDLHAFLAEIVESY